MPSSNPLPWLIPSGSDPSGYVPAWTLRDADFLSDVSRIVDRRLAELPEALVKFGRPDFALQLTQWLSNDDASIRGVAQALARRIACTPRSERSAEMQYVQLLRLAIQDLGVPRPGEDSGLAEACQHLASSDSETLGMVALVLCSALRKI